MKTFLTLIAAVVAVGCLAQSRPSADVPVPKAKLPLLLDLGAKKCVPCKMLAPILDELAKDYAGVLEVKFIDVWDEANAKEAEKYRIQSIPTQIYFDKDGKELWRHEGFISKEDMLAQWRTLGYDFDAPRKTATPKK